MKKNYDILLVKYLTYFKNKYLNGLKIHHILKTYLSKYFMLYPLTKKQQSIFRKSKNKLSYLLKLIFKEAEKNNSLKEFLILLKTYQTRKSIIQNNIKHTNQKYRNETDNYKKLELAIQYEKLVLENRILSETITDVTKQIITVLINKRIFFLQDKNYLKRINFLYYGTI